MRVPTNTSSENIISQIQRLATRQAQLQTHVSTGQKLFQPSDDPAAVGRVLILQNERAQIQQFDNNASSALEVSQASFAGLKALKDISDRAGEIATLGSGVTSPDAFRAYAAEINQLLEQALQVGNSKFRDASLFAGTNVGVDAFTETRVAGQITAVAYNGNSNQAAIQVSETSNITPGTTGATNTGIRDFITRLVALRDAMNSTDANAVAAARPNLEASENLLVNSLAEHGAVQLRIEVNQAQQKSRVENIEKLVSAETDADLPETVVRLSQTSTAYEAALSSATKILNLSLLDYIR